MEKSKKTKLAAPGKRVKCPRCGALLRLPGEPHAEHVTPSQSTPVASSLPNGQDIKPVGKLRRKRTAIIAGAAGITVIVAVVVGFVIYPTQTDPYAWIAIEKKDDGTIADLIIDPNQVPKAILRKLPDTRDKQKLNADQIRALAEKHSLFVARNENTDLCFNDFAVTWWTEHNRPAWEMELEFLSRQILLDLAERDKVKIPNQGALSYWSERVYRVLAKKAWEHDNR